MPDKAFNERDFLSKTLYHLFIYRLAIFVITILLLSHSKESYFQSILTATGNWGLLPNVKFFGNCIVLKTLQKVQLPFGSGTLSI